jgi:diguanylate cyclase (GGDEF)-like protein
MFNTFPPYLDKGPNGTPVGFAADMLVQAARQAKIDIRWVEIQGPAEDAFVKGQADLYPLMTITPEREARFYMSAPWWENQFALVSTEGHHIADAQSASGKTIATRVGVIQELSQRLFPKARFVNVLTLTEMEAELCSGKIDGFFADVRLLQGQLMQRTKSCTGQALHATSVPDSRLFLGTASTKEFAFANDRLFREIAKLALNGTLSRSASRWGIYVPYDTGRLRQVVEAEAHEQRLMWILAATVLVLTLSVIQTNRIRGAKREAESAQMEAREMHYRFDQFMKHTPAIAFIKDVKGELVYSNEPAPDISRLLSSGDVEVLSLNRNLEVTETVEDREGNQRHFLVLKFPFRGATGSTLLGGVALDVTARIIAEKELELRAKSDILTGLPNRRNFLTELGVAIELHQARGERLAVGFVDLDGFKRVNDQMGHEAGDELLKQTAARLSHVCQAPNMVARLGGDEFTFFVRESRWDSIPRIVTAMLTTLEKKFQIAGRDVHISGSIGVSVYPDHGTNPEQLLRNADCAMYFAKNTGKQRIGFWSPDLAVQQQKHMERTVSERDPVGLAFEIRRV